MKRFSFYYLLIILHLFMPFVAGNKTARYGQFIISYPTDAAPTLSNTKVVEDENEIRILKIEEKRSSLHIRTTLGEFIIPTSEFSIQRPSFNAIERMPNTTESDRCKQKKVSKKSRFYEGALKYRSEQAREIVRKTQEEVSKLTDTLPLG